MISGPKASQFTKPEYHFGAADAETVGAIVATASDIALVVDAEGVVQDFAIGTEGIEGVDCAEWVGREIDDLVTVDSRSKVRDLIAAARRGDPPRWREINHPLGQGRDDLPVRYCAIRTGKEGQTMLLGRDLRPVAALQRRLLNAQQSLERDYARLLQMETRYRLLFQSATEAFLIVDSNSGRIQEANQAAASLLGFEDTEIARRKFPLGLESASVKDMEAAMAAVRSSGRAESLPVRTSASGKIVDAFISMFRADGAKLFLVRLTEQAAEGARNDASEAQIIELFRRACEAIVLTDTDGRIEWANDAFLELVQVPVEGQVKGESLDRFFTRQGIDMPLILANTRESGRLRFYSTSVSGVHGTTADVEVSSVSLPDHGHAGYGFVFRNSALRPTDMPAGTAPLPRSVEQLTDLIGRVPMKELVRETVDVIERLCIEAALRMTDDNRASAADLLGLSRQSLYVKLRRYGLSDTDPDDRG